MQEQENEYGVETVRTFTAESGCTAGGDTAARQFIRIGGRHRSVAGRNSFHADAVGTDAGRPVDDDAAPAAPTASQRSTYQLNQLPEFEATPDICAAGEGYITAHFDFLSGIVGAGPPSQRFFGDTSIATFSSGGDQYRYEIQGQYGITDNIAVGAFVPLVSDSGQSCCSRRPSCTAAKHYEVSLGVPIGMDHSSPDWGIDFKVTYAFAK